MTQRQLAEVAFTRLIVDILEMQMDGPVALSLLGYTNNEEDIRYVLTMDDEEIDDLKYTKLVQEPSQQPDLKDEDTKLPAKSPPSTITYTTVELPRGYKRLIKIVISFNQYRTQIGNQIMDDWSDITSLEFNDFRIHTYNTHVTSPTPSRFRPANVIPSPNPSSPAPQNSLKQNSLRKESSGIHLTLRSLRIKDSLSPGIVIL